MWENFKKTLYNDEGAMWMGKGRWILPVPGTGEKKITTAAKIGIIIACVVGIAFVILTFWLGRPSYNYLDLPHFEILYYDMVGRPVAEVAPALGVKPDELIELSDGTYKLPQGEAYAGIAFEIVLHFENEMLSGFTYTADAPADAKEAAKDFANVAEMFSIKSIQTDDGTRLLMNKGAVQQYLKEKDQLTLLERNSWWSLEGHTNQDAITKYLQMLEDDPDWEGRVGEYLTKKACFKEEIEMEFNPDTQWVSIQLIFYVDAKPR